MESIWSKETKLKKREKLEKDISTDTVIIGAGMAGILTGYMLKQEGIENIIIDAGRICSGQTKNTTAKITSQHGVIYSKIEKFYGEEYARQYAAANQEAIEEYKTIIATNNIDCDFETKDAVLYAKNSLEELIEEEKSAKKAGIDCTLTSDVNLPFRVKGGLIFKNQAQFSPLKFVSEIIDKLTIYENTKATKIVGGTVYTENFRIHAKHIVVASHYPFINFPAMYFLRISSERSYVIALKNTNCKTDKMCIGADKDSLSLRRYNDLILLGGASHRTGVSSQSNPFDVLTKRAKELFPKSEIAARWSAQDCITLDGIPYIGKFSSKNPNIYIATGFNKWGMTSSMVSAKIISSMICKKECSYSDVFSPQRFSLPACMEQICKNTIETVKGFISHIKLSTITIQNLKRGTGSEVIYRGRNLGAYKDDNGTIYLVSLVCPHLKCKLKWNSATKTWDCPCHGSRYSYTGELIDNPAQKSSILVKIIQNKKAL